MANTAQGRKGAPLKPTEIDPWHDPWDTQARSLDDQRLALRRSLTAAPKDPE